MNALAAVERGDADHAIFPVEYTMGGVAGAAAEQCGRERKSRERTGELGIKEKRHSL